MPRISTSRDDAPAYLIRYENRRAAALAQPEPDADEPGFVARARARATDRALAELDQLGAPPGRTESFAFATTSPRELQLPESFRSRMAATTDVRLIRHGQTQGYISDGALTPLGRWQAHRKGQDLAKGIKNFRSGMKDEDKDEAAPADGEPARRLSETTPAPTKEETVRS